MCKTPCFASDTPLISLYKSLYLYTKYEAAISLAKVFKFTYYDPHETKLNVFLMCFGFLHPVKYFLKFQTADELNWTSEM